MHTYSGPLKLNLESEWYSRICEAGQLNELASRHGSIVPIWVGLDLYIRTPTYRYPPATVPQVQNAIKVGALSHIRRFVLDQRVVEIWRPESLTQWMIRRITSAFLLSADQDLR